MKKLGILVILAGLIMTVVTTATLFTREEVLEIGDLKVTAQKRHHFHWPPVAGIAVMALGGVFVWMGTKK